MKAHTATATVRPYRWEKKLMERMNLSPSDVYYDKMREIYTQFCTGPAPAIPMKEDPTARPGKALDGCSSGGGEALPKSLQNERVCW